MSRAAATLPTNISVPLEQPFKQTEATPGQVAGASFLGGANVVGVAFLANLLLEPRTQYILAVQGLGFIVGLMPILAAYATSFFAVPAIRYGCHIEAARMFGINYKVALLVYGRDETQGGTALRKRLLQRYRS